MNLSHLLTSTSILTLILTSCTSNEVGNSKDVNPDAIFFDYRIRGDEKDSSVTVYIQYRMGGPNGTTLVLNDPARVQLDSEILNVDSARLSGAFYELQKPSHEFAGRHIILFTDLNKKEYKEEFVYQPFRLKVKIPAVIKRNDLVFDLEGLEPLDYINVSATDTSFTSKDINRIDTVKNGRVTITTDELNALVNGPITIQFIKEIEKPVKKGTKEGGRITVSYGLQREFELKDGPL
jgi:Cu/Ag efflux protein CusF